LDNQFEILLDVIAYITMVA